ncbi:hypothetical protein [Amycolatopsis sp. NPDC051071]|uniref:hypothetical protein n=1 Tax=Amycolatopsis sp. NPDC051071 TaxID=3154637 RepID=UPI0034455D2E
MDDKLPRTRLEQLMSHRHMTVKDLTQQVVAITGEHVSDRQVYRWVVGEVRTLPFAQSQAALEAIFAEPVQRLVGPPYGSGQVSQASLVRAPGLQLDYERDNWKRQMIALSATRAREFLSKREVSTVGPETIGQCADDVRELTVRYQQEPLENLLAKMSSTQERLFSFLDGHQKPAEKRELYLLAGVASGLMARASHDTGDSEAAMTNARAAFTAANNAGHSGLKAWAKGLQSLISYWKRRYDESIKYAQEGLAFANANPNTSAVWLASGEARSLAALGRFEEAQAAVNRAADIRDRVQRDDLDELGGFCIFTRPRELYYAAEALAWGGRSQSDLAERVALEAITAYENAPTSDRAFGDEAGARCALAIARIQRSEFEGASVAMAEVLELPASQRTHGIVTAVEDVQGVLSRVAIEARPISELGDSMRVFSSERLALPK